MQTVYNRRSVSNPQQAQQRKGLQFKRSDFDKELEDEGASDSEAEDGPGGAKAKRKKSVIDPESEDELPQRYESPFPPCGKLEESAK